MASDKKRGVKIDKGFFFVGGGYRKETLCSKIIAWNSG